MANDRLDALKAMVERNSGDKFARYGLAMEYRNTGDLESALREFRALLASAPDYGAAYFHGGQTLEKLGRVEEAKALYREGVEATGRSGDRHTQGELQLALDLLG
jgi:tetratricopeptide (TPR) repeat protein